MRSRQSPSPSRVVCRVLAVGMGLAILGRPTSAQEKRPLLFGGVRGDFVVVDSAASVAVTRDSAYQAEAVRCARVVGVAEGDVQRLRRVTPLDVPRGADDSTAAYVSFFTMPRVVQPSGCVERTVQRQVAPLRGVRFTADSTTRPWFQPVGMALMRGDTVMYGQVVATAPSWRLTSWSLVRESVGLVRTSIPLDSLAPNDSGFSPTLSLAVFYGYEDTATVQPIPESVLRGLWRRALGSRLERATARPALAGIPPLEMPRAWNGRLRAAQSRAASGEYRASVTETVDLLESAWHLSRRDRQRAHLLLADIAFRHADTSLARAQLVEAEHVGCLGLPRGTPEGFAALARPIAQRDRRCAARPYVVAGLLGAARPGFGAPGTLRSPAIGVALTAAIVASGVNTVRLLDETLDLYTTYESLIPFSQDSAAAAAEVEAAYRAVERTRRRQNSSAQVTAALWLIGVADGVVEEWRRRRRVPPRRPTAIQGDDAPLNAGVRMVLAPDRIGLRWEFR